MKYLKPIIFKDSYYRQLEKEILQAFDKLFYEPLRKTLRGSMMKEFQNSISDLISAIRSHKIIYENGVFQGEMNSKLSKEIKALGGVFVKHRRVWSLPKWRLPPEVVSAIADAAVTYAKMNQDLLTTIDNMNVSDLPLFSYVKTIENINTDFEKIVRSYAIPPQLTPEAVKVINDEWAENLDLYIKGWANENILKLREDVRRNAFSGQRAGNLVKLLQSNYGSAKAKAKFLARQETSLLMSKMREQRMKSVGITKYRWATSHDEKVRPENGNNPMGPNHKILDGKIFSFDDPPITDRRTGAKNNPGEDFNCRCVAVPVVESAFK